MHRKGTKLLAGLLLAACALLTSAAAEDEPLYPIRKDGLWGYMNRAGETVIQPRWSAVYPFDGETALAVSRSASQLGERAGGHAHRQAGKRNHTAAARARHRRILVCLPPAGSGGRGLL